VNIYWYEVKYDKYNETRTLLEQRTRLKSESICSYVSALKTFCKCIDVENPFELIKLGLEKIEDLTEEYIRRHEHKLSPKYLNVLYCAVKTWCKATRLIKSRKLFREIDFDKSSRKSDALLEAMVTTTHVKQLMNILDIKHKIDVGLYGLVGLRPSLIPQLKVLLGTNRCGFHPRSAHIENGKLVIDRRPAIMIITRLDENGRPRRGNKGNITFFVFIPSKLCELIETFVNSTHDVVTPETGISDSRNVDSVHYKVKRRGLRKIGFRGRPYLLRKFADRILEQITYKFNDEDFKEFLMGHKGKISAVYQMSGLTEEDEAKYREMYVKACDTYINEEIFGTVIRDKLLAIDALARQAKALGVPQHKISEIREKTVLSQEKQLLDSTKKSCSKDQKPKIAENIFPHLPALESHNGIP